MVQKYSHQKDVKVGDALCSNCLDRSLSMKALHGRISTVMSCSEGHNCPCSLMDNGCMGNGALAYSTICGSLRKMN